MARIGVTWPRKKEERDFSAVTALVLRCSNAEFLRTGAAGNKVG
jgi:hypothetical protein